MYEDDPNHIVRLTNGEPMPCPSRGRIVTTDKDNGIAKTIVPMLQHWIPKSWNPSFKNDKTLFEFDVRGDPKLHSTIDLLTYQQDPQSHAGVQRDWIWFDEPPGDKVFQENMARLTHPHGIFWITATPIVCEDWLFDFIRNPPDNVSIVFGSVYEACHDGVIDQAQIEDMKQRYSKHEWGARLEGKAIQMEGLVYPEFAEEVHVIDDFDPPPEWPRIFALDPHASKPCSGAYIAIDPHDRWWVYDEYCSEAKSDVTVEAPKLAHRCNADGVLMTFIDHASNHPVPGGGGMKAIDLWVQAGLRKLVPWPREPEYTKQIMLHKMLRNTKITVSSVKGGRLSEDVVETPGLRVCRRCRNLIHNFMTQKYLPPANTTDRADRPEDKNNDWTDCIAGAKLTGITYSSLRRSEKRKNPERKAVPMYGGHLVGNRS